MNFLGGRFWSMRAVDAIYYFHSRGLIMFMSNMKFETNLVLRLDWFLILSSDPIFDVEFKYEINKLKMCTFKLGTLFESKEICVSFQFKLINELYRWLPNMLCARDDHEGMAQDK